MIIYYFFVVSVLFIFAYFLNKKIRLLYSINILSIIAFVRNITLIWKYMYIIYYQVLIVIYATNIKEAGLGIGTFCIS
jgi:hypothetical protein